MWRRSNSPLGTGSTATAVPVQQSQRDISQVQAGVNRVPFVKKSSQVGQNQLLTHSLSAFDLSHGHKLHLRSLKSTSIKMNFDNGGGDDDNDEDEDEDNYQDYADKENGNDGMAGQRYPRKGLGLQGNRWILQAVNTEALEWADLANKYSLDRNDSHSYVNPIGGDGMCPSHTLKLADNQNDQDDGIQKSSSTISSNGSSEVVDIDGIELVAVSSDKNDATNGVNPTKEQQTRKKVSRCSLASASSSSSGCADNDFLAIVVINVVLY